MAKKLVQVGPWKRGLNLRATPELIRDDELSQANNVVIRSDGTVVPRPGFQYIPSSTVRGAGNSINGGVPPDRGGRFDILGIFNDTTYLVGTADWNTVTSKWETISIHKGVRSTDPLSQSITWTDTGYVMPGDKPYIVKAVSYVNDAYFIPNYYGTTMHYAPGAAITLNFSSLSSCTIPQGLLYEPGKTDNTIDTNDVGFMTSTDLAFVWKDRLFICYKDRVYYSQATNFTVWDTSPGLGGFFDVGTDATNDFNYITGAILSGDTLHIFKPQGTYAFNYQTDPGTDGYLRVVSDKQGAYSVVSWCNRIFTCDKYSVYEYVSGQFIDIANQLDLSNNNAGYSVSTNTGGTAQLLNVMSDFLVLGPLIATKTPETSSRYYAMNLNNGAWAKWDAYRGVLDIIDAGDADTFEMTSYIGKMFGAQNSNIFLGVGERGAQLIMMNFNEDSREINDGDFISPSVQRLPRYYIETKRFDFGNDVAFKKVYRIQSNRNYGVNEDNPTASIDDTNRRGGFGAYYTIPGDIATDLDFQTKVQSLFTDHFGNVRVGSTFRCLNFSLFYEFYYTKQNTMVLTSNQQFYFRIDGFNVYVDQRADFSNSQSLASS